MTTIIVSSRLKTPGRLFNVSFETSPMIRPGNWATVTAIAVIKPTLSKNTTRSIAQIFATEEKTPVSEDMISTFSPISTLTSDLATYEVRAEDAMQTVSSITYTYHGTFLFSCMPSAVLPTRIIVSQAIHDFYILYYTITGFTLCIFNGSQSISKLIMSPVIAFSLFMRTLSISQCPSLMMYFIAFSYLYSFCPIFNS